MAPKTLALLTIILTKGLSEFEVSRIVQDAYLRVNDDVGTSSSSSTDHFTKQHSGVLLDHMVEECVQISMFIGEVIIDNTVNISNERIEEFFSSTCFIKGKLIIRNTTFKAIDLSIVMTPVNIGDTVIIVENNLKLESFVHRVIYVNGGGISFSNNPKLKYDELCPILLDTYHQRYHIVDKPNICGCIMDNGTFFEKLTKLEDNCTTLIANISLTSDDQPPYELLERKLSSVDTMYGSISVVNTSYTDLGFLRTLSKVLYEFPININDLPLIFISGNTELTKLKWYSFSKIQYLLVVVQNNPKLCLQTNEHMVAVVSELGGKVTSTICEDELLPQNFYRIPNKSWEGIGNDHTVIVGDVIIDENSDISQFYKFSNITMIYGHLKIQNSKLRTNSWLFNLQNIYPTKANDPAVHVENNTALRIFEFMYKYLRDRKVILRNNPRLMLTENGCRYLEEIGKYEIEGNLGNCGKVSDSGESQVNHYYFLKTLLVVWLML